MRTTRLASIAVLACAAIGAALVDTVQTTARAVSRIVDYGMARMGIDLNPISLRASVDEAGAAAKPAVALVMAKAFTQRLGRRDKPVTTPTWRMCPSA